MKLKFISAIAAISMLFGTLTASAESIPEITVTDGNIYAQLSGTVDLIDLGYSEWQIKNRVPYTPLQLGITIKDAENKTVYRNQLSMTDEGNNVWSYSTKLILGVEEGTYNIKLSTPYAIVYDGDIEYVDGTIEALAAIEDSTSLETFLVNNAHYMGVDLTFFNAYNDDERINICNELLRKTSELTTKSSVSDALEEAVFNAGLKSDSLTEEQKQDMLAERLESLGTDYDGIREFVNTYKLANAIIAGFDSTVHGSVEAGIYDLALEAYVNSTIENIYDLEVLFEEENLFSIPDDLYDDYTDCKKKTAFFKALNKKTSEIDDRDSFYDAIESALKTAEKSESSSSSSSSSSRRDDSDTKYYAPSSDGKNTEITATPAPTAKPEPGFNDMTNYAWAKDAVESLSDAGIISGDGNGNFMPQNNIRREEFAKIIAGAFKLTNNGEADNSFTDVNAGDWYYNSVMACLANNVTSGMTDTSFGVGAEITRQQAAVMIARIMKPAAVENAEKFADDGAIADYARDSIYALKALDLVSGYDDNTFNPTATITRAEAAQMIYNAIQFDGSGSN